MKLRLNKTTIRASGGIIASFVMLVSFQNCGKAGFDADLDSTSLGSTDAALTEKYGSATAAKVKDVPFAFDATFDTITYNSCAGPQSNGKAGYFTLKAGAYSTGGIKLKDEFFDYADENFKPIYPATALTDNQYKEILADSPANSGAVPVMAIRVKNSLTDVFVTPGSQTVTLWKDVMPLISILTKPVVIDSFGQRNVTATYFPFSPESRVMEAEWTQNKDEGIADTFRDKLSNEAVLSIAYLPSSSSELYKVRAAVPDAYPVKTAYGKSYSMTFGQYPGTNNILNPNHIMTSLTEGNLDNPTVGAKSWKCDRHYKVIRAGADATAFCPTHTQADLANAGIRAELEIMRRHLRADQWDINVTHKCVVPKTAGTCYDDTSHAGAPPVQYDLAQECYRPNGTSNANSACMHFVSVCIRD